MEPTGIEPVTSCLQSAVKLAGRGADRRWARISAPIAFPAP